MNKEELASLLNGREYGDEISKEEAKQAKSAGLVVVFGYSDDNCEFQGAIDDEVGCCDGRDFYLHRGGILTDPSGGDCEHCRERTEDQSKACAKLEAVWNDRGPYSWTYQTDIPHATFDIVEDGEKFCRGIVFKLSDLPTLEREQVKGAR